MTKTDTRGRGLTAASAFVDVGQSLALGRPLEAVLIISNRRGIPSHRLASMAWV